MKKKFVIIIGMLVLIFLGVYGWHRFIAYETAKFMGAFKSPTSSVDVIKVVQSEWHNTIPAVGSTIANQGVDINAEVNGQITKIFFESGDKVEKGQTIIQLNPSILEAQLESAQANLSYAKISYLRQKTLAAQNAGTYSDYDQAKATYDSDLAVVQQIKAQLAQTLIKAPFTGVLGIRQVNLGEYITAGEAIVNLQALQPMYVDFSVSENDIGKIQVGYAVSMMTVAYPDKTFSGKIVANNSTFDASTRSLQLRANIDNPDNILLPGMFANVDVLLPQVVKVLVIPQIAVNYSPVGDYVYVVKNNIATRQYVTIGERREDNIAILKGLSVGDEVVYAGQVKLKNGSKVIVEKTN